MRKTTVYAPDTSNLCDLIIALGQIAREQGYDATIRGIHFEQDVWHDERLTPQNTELAISVEHE